MRASLSFALGAVLLFGVYVSTLVLLDPASAELSPEWDLTTRTICVLSFVLMIFCVVLSAVVTEETENG